MMKRLTGAILAALVFAVGSQGVVSAAPPMQLIPDGTEFVMLAADDDDEDEDEDAPEAAEQAKADAEDDDEEAEPAAEQAQPADDDDDDDE